MKKKIIKVIVAAIVLTASHVQAATVLYDQDFENPTAFVNDGGDVNIYNPVNTFYGNQPPGFTFAQANTVETIFITGSQAFGIGYSDPSAVGGSYALGMLSNVQNDLLGLSFDVGDYNFLNVSLNISSIDLSVFGGPFVQTGEIPVFEFTLYDDPSGVTGLGNGTILSSLQAAGTASEQTVLDWTQVMLPLAAKGNTNGNVILRIDLLDGGYAAMDNFLIAASNNSIITPIPAAVWLLGSGLAGLLTLKKRRQKSNH
jgi:hypothetical protein